MAKAKTSITTENRSGSAADAAAKEKRTEMPLSDLHPFEGHPFKVLDDELMEQTVESIRQIGVVPAWILRLKLWQSPLESAAEWICPICRSF